MEAVAPVLADSLTQRVETADQEVRQSITGERCLRIEVPLTIGREVVHDIADAISVLAAEGELVAALRPADGVPKLVLVAQELICVAGI